MPKTIKKGDRGPDVERWQRLLLSKGFDPRGVDGVFGKGTASATRLFQREHGLTQDGVVGRKTWAAAESVAEVAQVLKRGSRGADVERWQRLLLSKGFDPNGVDGAFGPGTEKATKEFQRASGLKADGVVGSAAWSAALGMKVKTAAAQPKPKGGSGFLKDRVDLSKIDFEPAVKASGRNEGVIRSWNRYGGLLTVLSNELGGVDPDAAAAVLAVESGGTAMTDHGPVIRFENHIFFDHWGKHNASKFNSHFQFDGTRRHRGHKFRKGSGAFNVCHKGGQRGEYDVFRFAAGLNSRAAHQSISVGAAQIMGFNHGSVGYDSPEAMFQAYASGEGAQILGFFDFVRTRASGRLLTALRKKDWRTFAKFYNGTGQIDVYSSRMKKAFDQLRAAK